MPYRSSASLQNNGSVVLPAACKATKMAWGPPQTVSSSFAVSEENVDNVAVQNAKVRRSLFAWQQCGPASNVQFSYVQFHAARAKSRETTGGGAPQVVASACLPIEREFACCSSARSSAQPGYAGEE